MNTDGPCVNMKILGFELRVLVHQVTNQKQNTPNHTQNTTDKTNYNGHHTPKRWCTSILCLFECSPTYLLSRPHHPTCSFIHSLHCLLRHCAAACCVTARLPVASLRGCLLRHCAAASVCHCVAAYCVTARLPACVTARLPVASLRGCLLIICSNMPSVPGAPVRVRSAFHLPACT